MELHTSGGTGSERGGVEAAHTDNRKAEGMIELRKVKMLRREVWQFAFRIPYLFHFCVDGDGWFNFAICPHYSILGPESCNAPAALFYVERIPDGIFAGAFWSIQVERFLKQ